MVGSDQRVERRLELPAGGDGFGLGRLRGHRNFPEGRFLHVEKFTAVVQLQRALVT